LGDNTLIPDDILARNDVRRLALSDYDRALRSYVTALSARRGVKAIYQMGSIRFPGISDIDLIIIVDRQIETGTDFGRILRATAGPDGAYIFSHAPYVISEDGFRRLPVLFFADNLQHRWGQIIEFAPLPVPQLQFYAYHMALEAAIAQSFAFLRAVHARALPNLRSLLCHLNAVRHDFSTISQWMDWRDRAHWAGYVQRIDRLRGAWFETEEPDRLAETWALVGSARDILRELLEELVRVGRDSGYLGAGRRQAWFSLLDINILLDFSPQASVRMDFLPNPARFVRRLPAVGPALAMRPRVRELVGDVSVLRLPAALHPLIDAWNGGHGRLAEVLRRRRFPGSEPDTHQLPDPVRGWLVEKGQCLERYLSFVAEARLAGLLLLTPASWLQMSGSMPNRLKTRWNELWVRRSLASR
jgi:hypothetical protein